MQIIGVSLRVAVCVALVSGCAADATAPELVPDDAVPITGLASGASCPPNSKLSYANFGQAFFQSYCLRCHTAAISGAMRQAPLDRNFDELSMIRALAHQIDQQAGAGPTQQNQVMPPGDNVLALAERMQLAEWLACGAPR
jgi:uncharacterized membrane protein